MPELNGARGQVVPYLDIFLWLTISALCTISHDLNLQTYRVNKLKFSHKCYACKATTAECLDLSCNFQMARSYARFLL